MMKLKTAAPLACFLAFALVPGSVLAQSPGGGSGLSPDEAYKTFNMGVGMCVICDPDDVDAVCESLETYGQRPFVMGECVEGSGRVTYR